MVPLTISERLRLEWLMAARNIKVARARYVGSRLQRRRHGTAMAEGLKLVPRELRAADPSFAGELGSGILGLAGQTVDINGRSIFEIDGVSREWLRALHQFGWLRDLAAAGDPASRVVAVDLVRSWIRLHGGRRIGLAWDVDVTGHRLLSWLYNADVLLDGVEDADYERTLAALSEHLAHLARMWETTEAGTPRLVALIALAMASIVLDGQERLCEPTLAALGRELDLQVAADGGHVSRHPGAMIEPLVDLISLMSCLRATDRPLPAALVSARDRVLEFLRFMRHSDGTVARFNGMSATPIDRLATLFAHAGGSVASFGPAACRGGYARLEADGVVLIADVGRVPPLVHAGAAAAGALSCEIAIDDEGIFYNCGASPARLRDGISRARATTSHNTLELAAASSGRLVETPALLALAGAPALVGPPTVEMVGELVPSVASCSARHDGYAARFKLWHSRKITLGGAAGLVEGEDRLDGGGRTVRLARDVAFGVHFRAAPGVTVAPTSQQGIATITTRSAKRYTLSIEGAALSIEETADFSSFEGSRPGRQIVLRGASYGESVVRWRITRA